jgi:hypothetical protein
LVEKSKSRKKARIDPTTYQRSLRGRCIAYSNCVMSCPFRVQSA